MAEKWVSRREREAAFDEAARTGTATAGKVEDVTTMVEQERHLRAALQLALQKWQTNLPEEVKALGEDNFQNKPNLAEIAINPDITKVWRKPDVAQTMRKAQSFSRNDAEVTGQSTLVAFIPSTGGHEGSGDDTVLGETFKNGKTPIVLNDPDTKDPKTNISVEMYLALELGKRKEYGFVSQDGKSLLAPKDQFMDFVKSIKRMDVQKLLDAEQVTNADLHELGTEGPKAFQGAAIPLKGLMDLKQAVPEKLQEAGQRL